MTSGMLDRLVGIMPQVVVMGIFDNLREAIVGALEDIGEKMADAMTAWATWGVEMNIKILGGSLLPDVELFFDGPLSLLFGANFGLALLLLRGLIVIAILVSLVRIVQQRQTEFAGSVISSAFWLLAFGILFYPLYTLLLSGLREISEAALSNAADASDTSVDELTTLLTTVLNPGNLALQFFVGLNNGLIATSLIVLIGAMVAVGVMLSIFYPLSIVFKPFGKFGLNQFRLATSAVISIPVSLLIMMCLLAVELVAIRGANDIAPFLGPFATLILSFIFGIAIVATPIVIFVLAYTKVEEFVGSTDSKIQSGVDVLTMPEVGTRDLGAQNTSDKLQYVRQFATELPGAIASGENSAGTEAKELARQIGLKAAAASTNPVIAGAATAYTAVKVIGGLKESLSSDNSEKGGDST